MKALAFALLLAAPLSAQQMDSLTFIGRIPVSDPVIVVEGDTTVVNIEVSTDSLMLAIRGAQASLEAALARECDCGATGVDRGLQAAFLAVAIWGVWEFRNWARKPDVPDVTNVDVDVDAGHSHPPGTHKGKRPH